MKVTLDNYGLCPGVKKAISTIENLLKKEECNHIFTLGMVSHNKNISEHLSKLGIRSVDSIDSLKGGDTLVLPAYGYDKNLFPLAEIKGIKLIDASCSFVNYNLTYNKNVIYIGYKDHQETINYLKNCPNAILYKDDLKIDEIKDDEYTIISQTSYSSEKFIEISTNLLKSFKSAKAVNTICPIIQLRQKAILELGDQYDCIIVCGDKCSSNANRMYELALKHKNKEVYFINSLSEAKQIKNKNHIYLCSATSCPDNVVLDIYNYLISQ